MTDLILTRGDTNELTLTITAPDANDVPQPVDLTFCSLRFKLARDWDDPDLAAIAFKSIGNGITVLPPASAGIAEVRLEPEDTEALVGLQRLVYDVQLKESDATITTVVKGYVTVARDATRTIA